MAKAGLEAFKHGDTVKLVRGTRVREVSEPQLKKEIEVYSDSGIDDDVRAKLRELRRPPDSNNMIHEIADSLRELLNKIGASTSPTPDSSMMSIAPQDPSTTFASASTPSTLEEEHAPAKLVVVSELPEDETALPDWAEKGSVNARGITMKSPSHYIALCGLGEGVCNVLLDTAGAKTMIDVQTAELMGLEVEKTTASKYFGSFISATAVPTPYAGRVKGPISLRFSENVKI